MPPINGWSLILDQLFPTFGLLLGLAQMLELNRRRDAQGHPVRSHEELSPEDLALLRSLNTLDSSLYERAAELAEADFEFFRQVIHRNQLLEQLETERNEEKWRETEKLFFSSFDSTAVQIVLLRLR